MSRELFVDMAITIAVTFVVAAAVTYVYNVVAHGGGLVGWETAFELALVLGIVLPITRARGE